MLLAAYFNRMVKKSLIQSLMDKILMEESLLIFN